MGKIIEQMAELHHKLAFVEVSNFIPIIDPIPKQHHRRQVLPCIKA